MDIESRKRRDQFLDTFPKDGERSIRQLRAEELSNGDALEWYTYASDGAVCVFIIQVFAQGNGIEVYRSTAGSNNMDDTVQAIMSDTAGAAHLRKRRERREKKEV